MLIPFTVNNGKLWKDDTNERQLKKLLFYQMKVSQFVPYLLSLFSDFSFNQPSVATQYIYIVVVELLKRETAELSDCVLYSLPYVAYLPAKNNRV